MSNFSKSNGSRTGWLSWMSWRSVPGIKRINILINPWFSKDPLWSKNTSGMISEYELSLGRQRQSEAASSKQLQFKQTFAFSDLNELKYTIGVDWQSTSILTQRQIGKWILRQTAVSWTETWRTVGGAREGKHHLPWLWSAVCTHPVKCLPTETLADTGIAEIHPNTAPLLAEPQHGIWNKLCPLWAMIFKRRRIKPIRKNGSSTF